jgi:hypothetical protein
MALVPVTSYAAAWNPTTNQGRVFLQIGNGPLTPVPIDNAEEFTIILLMMNKTGVQFDTQTREIQILTRPVGT